MRFLPYFHRFLHNDDNNLMVDLTSGNSSMSIRVHAESDNGEDEDEDEEEEEEEENQDIRGSDDDEQEDPKDYCKGGYHPVTIGSIFNQRYHVIRKLGWGN